MKRTIETALRQAVAQLASAGADTPRLDAELLMAEAVGLDRVGLVCRRDEELNERGARRFAVLIERRRRREPVAYILGRKEFWGRAFKVNRHVLVPRPETELVVEVALARLRQWRIAAPARALAPARVLDLGTGSGAIAITLALEAARLGAPVRVTASDISPQALAVARQNAMAHGVSGQIELVESDLFASMTGRFDLIVSNPPYVGLDERERLTPEIHEYEPPIALYAGGDSLDVIRRVVARAPDHLAAGAALILEIGCQQGPRVLDLVRADGRWGDIQLREDSAGHSRVLLAVFD